MQLLIWEMVAFFFFFLCICKEHMASEGIFSPEAVEIANKGAATAVLPVAADTRQ